MQSPHELFIPLPFGDALSIDDYSYSSSSAPTIPSRAGHHLQRNSPSRVLVPSSPVPASQAQRTLFRSPGSDVEPTVRRLVPTSPPPHQHIDSTVWSKERLVLIYLFRITFVIDSSYRLLDRATRNGKSGPVDLPRGAVLLLLQTTTCVDISGNAS